MIAQSDAMATWLANNGVLISAIVVGAMLLAGGLLIAWAKGYRVIITRGSCPYCKGTGRDPGYQAPRPCRVCHGTGRLQGAQKVPTKTTKTWHRSRQPTPATPEAAEKLTARREAAAHRREALRQAEAMREEEEPYQPIE